MRLNIFVKVFEILMAKFHNSAKYRMRERETGSVTVAMVILRMVECHPFPWLII